MRTATTRSHPTSFRSLSNVELISSCRTALWSWPTFGKEVQSGLVRAEYVDLSGNHRSLADRRVPP